MPRTNSNTDFALGVGKSFCNADCINFKISFSSSNVIVKFEMSVDTTTLNSVASSSEAFHEERQLPSL